MAICRETTFKLTEEILPKLVLVRRVCVDRASSPHLPHVEVDDARFLRACDGALLKRAAVRLECLCEVPLISSKNTRPSMSWGSITFWFGVNRAGKCSFFVTEMFSLKQISLTETRSPLRDKLVFPTLAELCW